MLPSGNPDDPDDPFEATRKRIERLKAEGELQEPPRELPTQAISGTLIDPPSASAREYLQQEDSGWICRDQMSGGSVLLLCFSSPLNLHARQAVPFLGLP